MGADIFALIPMGQTNQMDVYKFSSFVLDPHTVRLMQHGQVVEVEPQVFETLLLLLRHNHRVVTKQELLDHVWQGRSVTDQVITRTIYEIRKILDQGADQSMIRTVRGSGYQMAVEVTAEPELGAAVSPPEHGLKWLHLSAFLLALLLLGWLLWSQQQPVSKPVAVAEQRLAATSYPIVAVLPIKGQGDSQQLSILTQSVLDYLTAQLALNLRMKVIHPDNMSFMQDEFSDMWAIQRATRAHFIIDGFLEMVSENEIKMHLTLYKKTPNNELTPYDLGGFQFPYPHTVKDLNDLYKQRKITVREIISIIKPGVTISDGGETETDDPEAYRLVIAAHHSMRSDSCEGIFKSENLLRTATERDPEFAYAWYKLFSNYFKRVWLCGQSAENYQNALEVAAIVDRLAPNRYQSVIIARNGILTETNRVEEAFETSRQASWDDPEALYRKVYNLRYAGFLDVAAEHMARILQLDPFYFNEKPIHQAPNTLLYLNRFAEHLNLLAEPGNAYHDYYRGFNLLLSGHPADAEIVLQSVLDKTPDDLFGRFSQALLHVLHDRDQDALAIAENIAMLRTEMGHSDGELTYKQAQLFALAGATDRALEQLQLAVDQGFFSVTYFHTDPAMQDLQDLPRFSEIAQQAITRHRQFAERFGLEPEIPAHWQAP